MEYHIAIPTASRIGIIIDLNLFENGSAHLFFYNYELTEILDTKSIYYDNLLATIPDFNKNGTPYPTPIPSGKGDQNPSNLNYPIVEEIPTVSQMLENGQIKVPQQFTIKQFLQIKTKCKDDMSLSKIISKIRDTIFKNECERENKNENNYLSFLNPEYYYNLPVSINKQTPWRNFVLFSETNTNKTTEYVNGANRIMVNLWNSNELNLDEAMNNWPNKYKPKVLPTSRFSIQKTNEIEAI